MKYLFSFIGAIYIYIVTILLFASFSFGDTSDYIRSYIQNLPNNFSSIESFGEYLFIAFVFFLFFLISLLFNVFVLGNKIKILKKFYFISGFILGFILLINLI